MNSVSGFFEGEMFLQKVEHLPEVSLTAGLMLLSNYQRTTFPALFFCICYGVIKMTAILVHVHHFLESHLCCGSDGRRIFVLLLKERLVLQLLLVARWKHGWGI